MIPVLSARCRYDQSSGTSNRFSSQVAFSYSLQKTSLINSLHSVHLSKTCDVPPDNSSCTDLNIINLWMKLQKIAESNKHNNSRGILGYNQKLHIEMSSLPGTSLRTCNEKYVSIQSCNRSAPSQVWRHFFSWTVTNNLLWKEECILLDHDIFMMASCTTSFFLQAKTKTFINLLTIACVKLLPNFVTSFGLQRATQFYFPYIAYQFLLDPAVFILGHLN